MIEALDLSNPANVAEHRDALVADLPEILEIGGFQDQVDQLRRGEHADVVKWLSGKVSIEGYGLNAGTLGFTPEQTRRLNPLAREHGLIADTRLWTPQDAQDGLVEASMVGEIIKYEVFPDYDTLPEQIFKAGEHFVIDGRFSGTVPRIDTQLEVAIRSELSEDDIRRLTVLTGMRAIDDDEGVNGLYREFLPDNLDKDTPISVAFPSATDAALAILRKRCSTFELIDRVDDGELRDKPGNRAVHPTLGARTWVTETYYAVHQGVPLLISVVNGEPIVPYGKAMNRKQGVQDPVASETFQDYLKVRDGYIGDITVGASFPHVTRFGAKLVETTQPSSDSPRAIGSVSLVGNMPLKDSWYATKDGLLGGGKLVAKELYPIIRAFNKVLDRPEGDLGV